jgi:DNA-binding transcriptional ArsR family regulator
MRRALLLFLPLVLGVLAPSVDGEPAALTAYSFAGRIHCEVGQVYNKTRQCQVQGAGHRDLFDLTSDADWRSFGVEIRWSSNNSQELGVRTWPWTVGEPVTATAGVSPLRLRVERAQGMPPTWKLWVTPPLNTSQAEIDQPFTGRAEFFGTASVGPTALSGAGSLTKMPVTAVDQAGLETWHWITAGITLAVVVWAARRSRAALWFVGLFARLARHAVSAHPRRRQILERIARGPHVSIDALRRELGLAHGAFEHHVGILLRHGVVRRVERWGHPYLMLPLRPLPPLLRDRILELVRGSPGLDGAGLAQTLGHPAKRIRYHLHELARAERLRLESVGGRLHCFPVDQTS